METKEKEGFFLATTYTTRVTPDQGPDEVLEFDARLVTVTPQGEPIAFGFARWENEPWMPAPFGVKEWADYAWYSKNNEGDNT